MDSKMISLVITGTIVALVLFTVFLFSNENRVYKIQDSVLEELNHPQPQATLDAIGVINKPEATTPIMPEIEILKEKIAAFKTYHHASKDKLDKLGQQLAAIHQGSPVKQTANQQSIDKPEFDELNQRLQSLQSQQRERER